MNKYLPTLSCKHLIMPGYEPGQLTTGIVHLGFGAFHRAHQALYTEEFISATGKTDWGIAVASLRSGQPLIDQLKKQGYWYSVSEHSQSQQKIKLVGAITEAYAARDDRLPLLSIMSQPNIRIVTLTITEKGYCLDPASHQLNTTDPEIIHDIEHPRHPKTAIGLIVEALALRKQAGTPPFSVLSCDNLPDNGSLTQQAVIQLAERNSSELAQWISREVCFPSSVVDRIVPAMTPEKLDKVQADLGILDHCAVTTESYRQWIIEDRFTLGRPDWDLIDGCRFVTDVTPWQQMKLQMLNGCHSLLAYLGIVAGYGTIAETINDARFSAIARRYLAAEAIAGLQLPVEVDHHEYADQIISRFSSPVLQHKTEQVARDGSQKLPVRWFSQLETLLKSQKNFDCIALGLAAWFHYLKGAGDQEQVIIVCDPLAGKLQPVAASSISDPVESLVELSGLFPKSISQSSVAISRIKYFYQKIARYGVMTTLNGSDIHPLSIDTEYTS